MMTTDDTFTPVGADTVRRNPPRPGEERRVNLFHVVDRMRVELERFRRERNELYCLANKYDSLRLVEDRNREERALMVVEIAELRDRTNVGRLKMLDAMERLSFTTALRMKGRPAYLPYARVTSNKIVWELELYTGAGSVVNEIALYGDDFDSLSQRRVDEQIEQEFRAGLRRLMNHYVDERLSMAPVETGTP